jgi:hypothetical protein
VNTLTGSIDFSFQTQIFALHLKMKGDQDSKMEKKNPQSLTTTTLCKTSQLNDQHHISSQL